MKSDSRFGLGSTLLATLPGIFLLCLGAFFAFRYGFKLLAALFLFFFFLSLVTRLWSARAIRGVSIRMECQRPRLFPGEETTIRYELKNDKFLPLVWLELSQNAPERECLTPDEAFERYQMPGQDKEVSSPALRQSFSFIGSWQTLQVDSTWKAQHRGIYMIDQLLARSGDCFGLAQEEHPLSAEQLPILAIYPRQVEVDLSPFLSLQWDCAAGGRGWMEDNTVLRGIREYQPGDNWKHINWRMTARQQGTPVNLYQTIQPQRIHFILDGESFCRLSNDYAELESTLEVLSSVLIGLSTTGISCSLSLPRSKRFPAMTLQADEDGVVDELLLHLAGYDCLAKMTEQTLLPSHFPADAAFQQGNTFLITYNGSNLPATLLTKLDPGKVCVLSSQEYDAPQRLGFRSMALDTLRVGGGST